MLGGVGHAKPVLGVLVGLLDAQTLLGEGRGDGLVGYGLGLGLRFGLRLGLWLGLWFGLGFGEWDRWRQGNGRAPRQGVEAARGGTWRLGEGLNL